MYHAIAPPRILALDAAVGPPSAAVVQGGAVLAFHRSTEERGAPSLLLGLVSAALAAAPGGFAAVAVTVGPGSFTGLRAAIALAQGLALGAGIPVVGVTVAEAVLALLPGAGRPIWVATDTKRGRVFLTRGDDTGPFALDALPTPDAPIALAGDAAEAVAARLAMLGADVVLTSVRGPDARGAGLAGARRLAGDLPPLAAQPLYGEPPEARPPPPSRPPPT